MHPVALLSFSLLAGCAGRAVTVPDAAPALTQSAASLTEQAAPTAAAAAQPLVVDGNALAQRSEFICRDVLKMGSNVHVTQCMTLADWKLWERRQAQEAQEMVRIMQGSRYR
jgi:hypothetical protein